MLERTGRTTASTRWPVDVHDVTGWTHHLSNEPRLGVGTNSARAGTGGEKQRSGQVSLSRASTHPSPGETSETRASGRTSAFPTARAGAHESFPSRRSQRWPAPHDRVATLGIARPAPEEGHGSIGVGQRCLGSVAVPRAVGLPWSRQVWGGVSRGARAERLAETTRAAFPRAFAITALGAVLLSLAAAAAVAILRRDRAAMRTARPPPLSRFVSTASRTQQQSPVRGGNELQVVVDQTSGCSGVVVALSAL